MASSARIDELRKKFDENPRRYFAPLANEYRKLGDLEQALFICQEYLPQQPGHMSGHIVYGQALFEMHRREEAQVVFETALSLDPENLIALRHLGDIAREMGDTSSARAWYQRVLEADPRNEEIAQIMISLLAAPDSSSSYVSSTAPTPLTNPAVPDTTRSGFSADSPLDAGAIEPAYSASDSPAESPFAPPPPPWDVASATTASDGREFLDLNDFSLGGVPLRATPTPATNDVVNDAPEEVGAVDMTPAADMFPASQESDDEVFEPGFIELSMPDSMRDSAPVAADDDAQAADSSHEESALADQPAETHADIPAPDADRTESGEVIFTLGQEDGPFEEDPFAIAVSDAPPADIVPEAPAEASAEAPPIELATDLSLGLPDDGVSPDTSVADDAFLGGDGGESQTFASEYVGTTDTFDLPSQIAPPEQIVDFEPSAADDDREPGLTHADIAADIEEEVKEEIEEAIEPPSSGPDEQAVIELAELPPLSDLDTGADVETPAAASPEAFVTETMAQLYLQQGHLELARDIYVRLVDQRPDDMELRERLAAVDEQLYDAPAETVADDFAPAPADSGPTIREFLLSFVASRGAAAAESVPASELPSELPSDLPDDSGQVDHSAPSSNDPVRGSIDALFAGADASASDAFAADTFQKAFGADDTSTESLPGIPAHRASGELSLDHVFKANAPPRSAEDGFSFDQFFADDAGGAAPNGAGESGASTDATDDIAQFNAWLNGLKKT